MTQALVLPTPLRHQRPVLDHPSRRKVWRAGRRVGKTRAALLAGADGHGPRDAAGNPALPGMLQGGDVLWLSPDYPQSAGIWREEILRRFDGLPGVEVSRVERRVSIPGYGSLELRSAEAIDGVRGRSFDGVIIDEAAFLDLEGVLGPVILPTLLDRDGWLFVIGSPNGGHDGNAAHRVPSAFNLLCEEVMAGTRPGWVHWHNRTEDNATLPRPVIEALRAEYPHDSATAQQELDALLVAGGGRFYPELIGSHGDWLVPSVERLPWAEYWGSYDWGYSHPAVFCQFMRVADTVTLLDSLHLHKHSDEEQAAAIRGAAYPATLRQVFAGHDAFAKRMAHAAQAETVADIFDRYGIALSRANIDRAAGAKAVRRLLRPGEKGVRLQVVDTPGNRRVLDELSKLVPDPLNVNVPAKRDADERGLNGDDGADAFRYGVVNVGHPVQEPVTLSLRSNVTDGRDDVLDPFAPQVERTAGGWTVEYGTRDPGPAGQFGF